MLKKIFFSLKFISKQELRSLPGAGECIREKAAPLVFDRIVENVSNVSICRNCKVCYKVKFLAYDMKCSPGEGLHMDALGYTRQSALVST